MSKTTVGDAPAASRRYNKSDGRPITVQPYNRLLVASIPYHPQPSLPKLLG